MEDVLAILSQPLVSTALTFIGTLLGAYLKRVFDLRTKRLELEALKVATQIEMVSQQRKRTLGTATPSSVKLTLAKDELKRSIGATRSLLPPPTEAALSAAVEKAIPHVHAIRDAVMRDSEQPANGGVAARDMPPRSPTGFSGDKFMAVHTAAETSPPPIPRPSGDHDSVIEFDLPKDDATLDDGGEQ